MSFGRCVGHVKRKLRVILIFITAVTFTASLAYYNSQQQVSSAPRSISRLNLDNNNEIVPTEGGPPVDEPKGQEKYEAKKVEEPIFNKEEELTRTTTISLLPKKTSSYPSLKESCGEFDTIDIYRNVGQGLAGSTKRNATREKLRVFILPFTHVDPGWLRTFDSYSNDTNQILNNMHSFMMKNPAMRFMWAEFVFFERWWNSQNETVKENVRKLVKEGRLELASGSWVMTDEANAYFPVSVDNIVEGHQFLLKEFEIKPSTIWTNDPFGYSNSVPYLFRKAGIKRNVINRIHHQIKNFLQGNRAIPFQWRQYFDSGPTNDVLTHVLPYTHYDVLNSCGPSPSACCEFDFKRMTHWSCPGPKPVPITPENVKMKAQTLVGQLKTMAQMYEAPVMLQMHGDDFRFDMIEEWNQHHDNFIPLFEEINKGSEVEISFGTFNDYFTELEKWYAKNKVEPAVLTGDFFPYKCAMGDMWTGYYTTRPFYKRQGRILHSLIRSADLALAALPFNSESVSNLETARRTLSLFQHHDAITGTSKIHVMKDYSRLLFEAQNKANTVLQYSLKRSLKTEVAVTHSAALFNETQTKHRIIVDNNSAFVSVFNPLPFSLTDTVSVRVNSTELQVISEGVAIAAQIEPYIYKGDVAQDDFLLTFAVKLRPLGVTTVEIKQGGSTTKVAEIQVLTEDKEKISKVLPSVFKTAEISELKLSTTRLTTKHDPKTGFLTGIGEHTMNMSIVAYRNAMGGAYLMRGRSVFEKFGPSSFPKMIVKGEVQQSIHLFMGNIYQRMTAKEIDGPFGAQLDLHLRIDIRKESNTEVALRLQTDFEKPEVFADSVGLQLLHRQSHPNLEVPANYYPMPSAVVIENERTRLTIGSNVEHGMMQITGGVEIMVDRILNQDDGKGLGSSPDAIPTDMLPVDMQFSLLLEKKIQKDSTEHYTAHSPSGHLSVQNILYPPVVAVSSDKPPISQETLPALPCDYQLLTIRPIQENKKMLILFRHGTAGGMETSAACGEDVTKTVKALLKLMNVSKVIETNLSGTETVGKEKTLSEIEVRLEPFQFFTLIAT